MYDSEDIVHESDMDIPLQHGFFRYVAGPDAPMSIRENLGPKNDKPFIFVPKGYLQRKPLKYFNNILDALGLALPNMVIVTAATEGTEDEQQAKCFDVRNPSHHPHAIDKSFVENEAHRKDVLLSKVNELLLCMMESACEIGGWVVPQQPRRRNGGASMICKSLHQCGDQAVCLGLIGLDHADADDVALQAAITEAMEPIESPLRTVAKVEFDPFVNDGAPCPQMSHFLFFESPRELIQWREDLLAAVPDMLLAFGDLTDAAFGSVFEGVVEGSPVVLLKHTSPDIDNLALMFKHAKAEFAKQQQQQHQQNDATTSSSIVSTGAHTNKNKIRLTPMPDMDDEQIRRFVSTWPSDYNPATTVCIDPLLNTPAQFEKKVLQCINAAFDLKKGSTDFRKLRKSVLDYAWSFHDVVEMHTKQKDKQTRSLFVKLTLFTLSSVVASVLYDRFYGDATGPKVPFQLFLFVSTILLPLYVTSLKQESDKDNPITKWVAFRVACAKLESEIFKFRCQVGVYRAEEKNEAAMRKTVSAFTAKTRDIWQTLQKRLPNDGMTLPLDFWGQGSPLEQQQQQGSKMIDPPPAASWTLEDVKRILTNRSLAHPPVEKTLGETSPLLAIIPENMGTTRTAADTMALDDEESDDEESDEETGLEDDGYFPICVDNYTDFRMGEVMKNISTDLDVMVQRNDKITQTIKMITILSGGAAALSMQWFVPVILAVTAALGSEQEFGRYTKRIELANHLVVKLNDLKLWWMGLSMYERQLPQNKDKYVIDSETAIVHQIMLEYGITDDD